jgi:hypothetical protein
MLFCRIIILLSKDFWQTEPNFLLSWRNESNFGNRRLIRCFGDFGRTNPIEIGVAPDASRI